MNLPSPLSLKPRGRPSFASTLMKGVRALNPFGKPSSHVEHYNDGALVTIERMRLKSGARDVYEGIRMGPNHVHAFITHPCGGVTNLGVSKNLLTNIGRDWMAAVFGGYIPVQNGPATAATATSVTGTSTTWTASNLATPQLGLAGMRVYMPITGLTTAPVYGNIVSNSTSVATIDQWWTAADGTGTTPAGTSALIIAPGNMASCRFMALTTDSGAASASDTALASEATTAGCGRALATYAHTMGQATFTLVKAFSVTGTLTSLHKMGLFCSLTASTGIMVFETVLNVDATVANGDTLTVTDTVTCSG